MDEIFETYDKAKARAVELTKMEGLVCLRDNADEYDATVQLGVFGIVTGFRFIIVETTVTTHTLFYV